MKHRSIAGFAALATFALAVSAAPPASPYVGQETRDIKALSAEEISTYLGGKGGGFAKAAELNGYPGPAHVLELAAPLALTPAQRTRTETLFASMEARAKTLGRALVEEERKLDQLFAGRTVTPARLNSALNEIGALQAKVRAVHLEAHLSQVEILTPEQIARYAGFPGYGGTGAHAGHGAQRRH